MFGLQKSLPFLRLSLSLNKIRIDGLRAPQMSGSVVRTTLPGQAAQVRIVTRYRHFLP